MTLDLDHLAARATRAAQSWAPGTRIAAPRELPGGKSSLTFLADVLDGPAERVVLKVAVPGREPVLHRDVLRQARVLRVLEGIDGIVTPPVHFEGVPESLENPPFFGMAFVDGDSFEPYLGTGGDGPSPREVTARALAATRMLAALHAVPAEVAGPGERPVSPADELDRWVRTFETVDGDVRGRASDVAAALRAVLPVPVSPRLTHGDYRLGNMLSSGSTVRAVIDWEIWSIGDPRTDLAWLMMNADPDNPMATRNYPGMPKPAELRAEYEAATGTEVRDLAWFEALTQFKLGATVALILKHRRRSGRAVGRLAETVESALRRVQTVAG